MKVHTFDGVLSYILTEDSIESGTIYAFTHTKVREAITFIN
jgi:hypothetical protein